MIDLSGLPLPPDAPPAGSCVRVTRPEPGLVVLALDPPHRSLAVFDAPLLRDLDLALTELESDAEMRALVITGREPLSFAAGADVKTIAAVREAEIAARFVRAGQQLFERIHRLSQTGGGRVRVVAAVGGPVPGGACEICLACDRIVLANHPKTRIGLPEVRLGIIPGWGGSQRLPRRIGVPAALGAILQGKLHVPYVAHKLGIVDRLAAPEDLVRIASAIALGKQPCARRERGAWSWLVDRNPLALALIRSQAKKQVLAETKGRYPAALEALDLVSRGPSTPLTRGLEREVDAVRRLATGSVAQSLISLFLLSEEAKRLGKRADGSSAPAIRRGGVIGAGVMGGAIASLMAESRIDVRLSDLSRDALGAAELAHRSDVAKALAKRRLERSQADLALDRFEVSGDLEGFARCDLVLEAVAERIEVKRKVFGELARRVRPDCLLATNTSSLSVTAIAEGLPHPERVVGVHFFNPVKKMPLVEIVRGRATSDETVARASAFALALGKTPVVVADVAGFLVNRILGPYLDEAVRLYEQGADPAAIDAAAVDFGMPMGPLELIDEVGLDIAAHAGSSLVAAYGARMRTSGLLTGLVAAKELGKKSGRGIWAWEKGKGGRARKAGLNPKLPKPSSSLDARLSRDELTDRMILAFVAEAARCLDERVVASERELDLASVFGTGFAPFEGGVWSHARRRGLAAIARRLGELAASPGVAQREGGRERYAACPALG
ncbi:MAG: hypothetical protein FJ299_08220 [Planctomycetes bacterium]|nr:hypothetical protein [Planctomycetota bacterium]